MVLNNHNSRHTGISAIIAYTFYDNNPSIPAYQEKMHEQDFEDLCLIEI